MTMTATEIERFPIPPAELEDLCRRWQIVEFSLFGSVLRDDFDAKSDIDILVSFEKGAPWSLLDLINMRDELADRLGRKVDFIEKEGLRNPFRRHEILKTRKVIYARSA